MIVRSRAYRFRATVALAAITTLIGGCATTTPQPKFTHAMVPDSRIAASDTVDVKIETADKVVVDAVARDRITQKIKLKIDERKLKNPAAPSPRAMQVVLHVTKYEKGNAFARAMLAGLGQIHLEGTISVYQMPDHVLLEDFDLQKTFAWGGVYGASTSIEQIEDIFTDSVAATVTGQEPPAPPKAEDTTHKTSN
ncbi:MAG: DUF4410 domain-containing protein [Gammaproteobacteria bacterium]|nr:DUF4410 domain-containing protein [Gammaproteobacteria bacterium]